MFRELNKMVTPLTFSSLFISRSLAVVLSHTLSLFVFVLLFFFLLSFFLVNNECPRCFSVGKYVDAAYAQQLHHDLNHMNSLYHNEQPQPPAVGIPMGMGAQTQQFPVSYDEYGNPVVQAQPMAYPLQFQPTMPPSYSHIMQGQPVPPAVPGEERPPVMDAQPVVVMPPGQPMPNMRGMPQARAIAVGSWTHGIFACPSFKLCLMGWFCPSCRWGLTMKRASVCEVRS